jgi:hypothetical protein
MLSAHTTTFTARTEFYDDNMDSVASGDFGEETGPEDGHDDGGHWAPSPGTADRRLVIMGIINALLQAYASLQVTELLGLFAPSFRHQVFPESLGMPARDLAAFAKHAETIFSIFDEFHMIPIQDPLVSYSTGPPVVTILAKMKGVLKGSKGPWVNECVLVIGLTPDASKIVEIQEFVDSSKAILMARKLGSDSMGRKKGFEALVHKGIPTVVSSAWLLLTMTISSVIGSKPALVVLWVHPVLQILLENMVKDDPLYKMVMGGASRAERLSRTSPLDDKLGSAARPGEDDLISLR